MKIGDLLKQANKIDSREAILLLAYVLKKPESFVSSHSDSIVKNTDVKRFLALIKRRENFEPIAYLVESQPFMGLDFFVNKHTLIPRPETETLVEKVIEDIDREVANKKKIAVVDIGTGSGCIACSIKKRFSDALVIASDNSPATLSVVKYNDKKFSTGVKVFLNSLFGIKTQQELEKKISSEESVALFIVANLPYLPYSDMNTMQKDVVGYEPKNALFADDDGMALIKKCIQQIKKFLAPYPASRLRWRLYFEIDPRQVEALTDFVNDELVGANVEIKKDLCGRDRFLIIGH